MLTRPTRLFSTLSAGLAVLTLLSLAQASQEESEKFLDRGFRLLYDRDFAGGQREFSEYQRLEADDPRGPISEAAGLLFGEFDRLGILESQFLTDDCKFFDRKKLGADPSFRQQFNNALSRTEKLSKARLATNSKDANSMFAMTLHGGLQADYAALIENRNMAALSHGKQASIWAQKLLAQQPSNHDAYVATGVGKYVIGNLIAPLRWMLSLGGFVGDKQKGIEELTMTAEKGRFLAPFARILLAIANAREKNLPRAKELLVGLKKDFPHNSLFTRELERLDVAMVAANKTRAD